MLNIPTFTKFKKISLEYSKKGDEREKEDDSDDDDEANNEDFDFEYEYEEIYSDDE